MERLSDYQTTEPMAVLIQGGLGQRPTFMSGPDLKELRNDPLRGGIVTLVDAPVGGMADPGQWPLGMAMLIRLGAGGTITDWDSL